MPENKNENKVHPNVKGRVIPQNNEAEQYLLCCMLIDDYVPNEIIAEIRAEDFYSIAHRLIFEGMQSVYSANKPIDIVTLKQALDELGTLEAAGGLGYINTLSNLLPSAANYRSYLEIVKENKLRRKIIDVCGKITDVAFAGDSDAMEFAEKEIFALGEGNFRSTLKHVSEPTSEAIERMELIARDPLAFRGIPTGFKRLDDLLNGFQCGDLIIIAARPGQGKTSIGMNFIQAAAFSERTTATGQKVPIRAAVFSLEMPAVQLARRMICSVAKVDMTKVNSGKLEAPEWKRIMLAKTKLDAADIYIDDTSNTTPVDIISKCRKLKREKGLDIVMIDYLQLMSSSKRTDNRQQEIADITRTLKIAAKELNVPILLLSQLSREVEKRKEKVPVMSDLRESGAIEQDADIIMFLYREYSDSDTNVTEDERNAVQLIVAKHRNGQQGTIDLKWRGAYVSFDSRDDVGKTPQPKATTEAPEAPFNPDDVPPPSDENAPPPSDDDTPSDEEAPTKPKTKEELMNIDPTSNEDLFP